MSRRSSSHVQSRIFISLFGASCFLAPHCQADVKMPAIFGDHMVLQQDTKLPVWGWADPGEKVRVNLGVRTAQTTAGADGKWRVDLAPLPATEQTLSLSVTGKNSLKFEDVLVGDVWLCAGQSNMDYGIGGDIKAGEAIKAANFPKIRLFLVPSNTSMTELEDVAPNPENSLQGKWQVCSPAMLKDIGGWNGFSAVGYNFGREIHQFTGRPVGLIASTRGGTAGAVWLSQGAIKQEPPFANYVEQYQKTLANPKDYYENRLAESQAQHKIWEVEVNQPYQAALKEWQEAVKVAKAASQPEPPKPTQSRGAPWGPGIPNTPSSVFNATIAPLIPYALKGALWYQGESNAANVETGTEYARLLPRLIADWRGRWGQGDFAFLVVQLAGFREPKQTGWPLVREAQLRALSLPRVGMAVAVDIGHPNDVHPRDKYDVGVRLALAAKHVAYGQNLVYSGPLYDAMKVEGNRIRLSFKHVGSGLTMGVPPWTFDGKLVPTPTELTGFEIAGADKNFVAAKATVEGDTLVVSSDQITAPVAVRYGWADNPTVNLYNREGLPASPFRTDS